MDEAGIPSTSRDSRSPILESDLKRPLSTYRGYSPDPPYKRRKGVCKSILDCGLVKAELIGERVKSLTLENKVKRIEQQCIEEQILHDTGIQKFKDRAWWDKLHIRDLDKNINTIRERESRLTSSYIELQHKHDSLRGSSDLNIERLENKIMSLKNEFIVERCQMAKELSDYKQTVYELQQVLKVSREIESTQKARLRELDARSADRNDLSRQLEIKTCELYNAQSQLKSLQFLKDNYEEYKQQSKTQNTKIYGYGLLEKENDRLRGENKKLHELIKGKLVLEEQVNDLKNRLKKYKDMELEVERCKANQIQSNCALSEWRAIANGLCGTDIPDSTLPFSLKCIIDTMQKQEVYLTSQKVQLESSLKAAVIEGKLTTVNFDRANKQCQELKRNFEDSQNTNQRLQSKISLVSAERNSYRSQLEFYEYDLCPKNVNAKNYDEKELIKKLNKVVDEYRTTVANLEKDLQTMPPPENSYLLRNKIIILQYEVEDLKIQNEYLRSKRDSLEEQLEKLATAGFRDDNISKADYQSLVKQTDQLKNQIIVNNAQMENLKIMHGKECEQIKRAHKNARNTVIKEIKRQAKETFDAYVNVVFILFGYKIVTENNNRYTLTSIFANNEDEDQLCFQLGRDGIMNLLENNFSLSLGETIDVHLRQNKSIPTFLSTITVDLFNNQPPESPESPDSNNSSESEAEESDNESRISVHDSSPRSSNCSSKASQSSHSDVSDSGGEESMDE